MKKRFNIGGMTCVNCQSRIETSLKALSGVKEVNVNYRTGVAEIEFDVTKISFSLIEQTIKNLGYEVRTERKADQNAFVRTIGFLTIIIALYIMLQQFGVLNLLVPSQLAESGMGYGMLFVIGLLTSVHCIAMCGGINLSQCLPVQETEEGEKKRTTFFPVIFYNLGRVISYTMIGCLLGLIGWLFGGNSDTGVPMLLQGNLKMIAGLLMVIMGINMLGIFPWLRGLSIRIPNFVAQKLGRKKANATRPFVVGLLNGLMPCGPLQSMQILSFASANPLIGALSMFFFSLGTVPLMFGFGSMVSILGKRFTHAVMNIGAVLVTVLGFAMFAQGSNLSGMFSSEMFLFIIIGLYAIGIAASIPFTKKAYRFICGVIVAAVVTTVGILCQYANHEQPMMDTGIEIVDGVQIVNSTLFPGEYPTITVQKGIPVKWTIHAPEESINGCNYKMIIQEYGIEYTFENGENIIEFLPANVGTFSYTCWMGMIEGSIVVAEHASNEFGSSETTDETLGNGYDIPNKVQTIHAGEYLSIPISEITETATFYSLIVDGIEMEVFAIKASDGTIRTAFNTCQMCYTSGNGYYIQNDKHLICQNCGSRFTADQVEYLSGGCNPWPIPEEDKTVTEDSICISYDVLKKVCDIFTYRKR